jgi:peptide/nickel transport system substrate-binding protein
MRLLSGMLLYGMLIVLILGACTAAQPSRPQAEAPSQESLPRSLSEVIAMDESERRQAVVWDLSSGPVENPAQWNPLARDARRDKGFHQVMIEPLFILNYESGVIEPWLGEQMTVNPAQDVWTLRLREGVRWSDGEGFNADDVIFTVDLLLNNPELELDFLAGFVGWVESIEKVDDLTVRFNLTASNPRFQLDFFSVKVWGSFPIVPEHIWHNQDPLTFTNYDPERGWPVFTGPYTLESFTETTFVYVRNDDWWGTQAGFKTLPAPRRMIWTTLGTIDPDNLTPLVYDVDALGNMPLDLYQAIEANRPNLITWLDGQPFAWMDPCSRLLSPNHMVPPWDEHDMRYALNYAIDRQEIVSDAYNHTTVASRHFFPAYPPLERYVDLMEEAGIYNEYPLLDHDPERARQLIETQGWTLGSDGYYQKDGQQLSLVINAHEASRDMQATGSVIAAQLRDVGINASMVPLTNEQWIYRKTTGQFDALIDWDACGSINEPWASLDRYHSRWVRPLGEPVTNYNNQVRWSNAEYSALVDQMAPLPLGDPQVDELFVQAMRIWAKELPFIPLVQEKQLISFDTTYWTNWPTASNNYVHPPSWWQSTHIIVHSLEPAELE